MASITTRKRKDGQLAYLVQIRIEGAKAVNKQFDDPIKARKWADEKEGEIRELIKRHHIPNPSKFYKERFSDVIDLYLNEAKPSKKHRCNLSIIKKHIGSVCMGELRTKWVKSYVQRLEKTKTYRGTFYNAATIAVHLSVMGCVYRWRAEEYDLDIGPLPFSTRHLPRGWEKHRERRLDPAEEQSLISVIETMKSSIEWTALLTLALETGARQQELIFATWSEISSDQRLWTIPAGHTKTKKTRFVPLTQKAKSALASLRTSDSALDPKERIFRFLKSPSSACSAFRSIVQDANIEDFRFHDLRHEAISRMVLYWRQYNVFEIMQIVGHSSTEMLNRYANLRGEELVQKMHPDVDKPQSTQ